LTGDLTWSHVHTPKLQELLSYKRRLLEEGGDGGDGLLEHDILTIENELIGRGE
jgi:hypothetical protein